MKKHRRIILMALPVLFVGYVGAYYLLVDRGWPGAQIAAPDDTISCPPRYCDYDASESLCDSFFLPMHMVDRIIRGHYWNPVVKDLAEQARREGVFSAVEDGNEK